MGRWRPVVGSRRLRRRRKFQHEVELARQARLAVRRRAARASPQGFAAVCPRSCCELDSERAYFPWTLKHRPQLTSSGVDFSSDAASGFDRSVFCQLPQGLSVGQLCEPNLPGCTKGVDGKITPFLAHSLLSVKPVWRAKNSVRGNLVCRQDQSR
jgi:hypothetical protein